MVSKLAALQVWDWVQWRLPYRVIREAQQEFRNSIPPPQTDPLLASIMAELLHHGTPRPRKVQLSKQLLILIRDG